MSAMRNVIVAMLFAFFLGILPAAGNAAVLASPKWWFVILLGAATVALQPSCNPFRASGSTQDRGTMLQILWSFYVTQLLTNVEATYFQFPNSVLWHWWSPFPLAGMAFGLALRTWSVRELGEHFTMHIAVAPAQPVVCTGPYRYVRHPSYVGAFIAFVSVPFFLSAWFSVAATCVVLAVAFLRRIRWEEETMYRVLGEKYSRYASRVKRVCPGVW